MTSSYVWNSAYDSMPGSWCQPAVVRCKTDMRWSYLMYAAIRQLTHRLSTSSYVTNKSCCKSIAILQATCLYALVHGMKFKFRLKFERSGYLRVKLTIRTSLDNDLSSYSAEWWSSFLTNKSMSWGGGGGGVRNARISVYMYPIKYAYISDEHCFVGDSCNVFAHFLQGYVTGIRPAVCNHAKITRNIKKYKHIRVMVIYHPTQVWFG